MENEPTLINSNFPHEMVYRRVMVWEALVFRFPLLPWKWGYRRATRGVDSLTVSDLLAGAREVPEIPLYVVNI